MGFNSGFKGLINLEFSRQILGKNIQISNFMKIRLVVAELFHVYGCTDGHTST